MFSTTATSYMLIVRVYVHNPLTTQIPRESVNVSERERVREKGRTKECNTGNTLKIGRSDKCKRYTYIHIHIYIYLKQMTERANCESRVLHMYALCMRTQCKHARKIGERKKGRKEMRTVE